MSVNKVILVANATKDCELRYTGSGTAVANFSVATNERYKDRDGNVQEKAEFHNIVAWRQLAEICGKYITKGKQVYLEGKITTRSYEDRDGVKKYITEIVADQMQFLGSRSDASSQGNANVPTRRESASRGQHGSGTGNQQQDDGYQFGDDSEIPF